MIFCFLYPPLIGFFWIDWTIWLTRSIFAYISSFVYEYQLFTHLIRSPGCWAILLMNDVGSSGCGCKLSSPPRHTCCWHIVKIGIDYDYNNILSQICIGGWSSWSYEDLLPQEFCPFPQARQRLQMHLLKKGFVIIRWKFITRGLALLFVNK